MASGKKGLFWQWHLIAGTYTAQTRHNVAPWEFYINFIDRDKSI